MIFFKKSKWIGDGELFEDGKEKSLPVVMKVFMKSVEQSCLVYEFSMSILLREGEDYGENYYTLTFDRVGNFHVLVSNKHWGHVEGKGIMKKDFIGWELFGQEGGFHCYESIEVQKSGELLFIGEYKEENGMATKIRGALTSYENVYC